MLDLLHEHVPLVILFFNYFATDGYDSVSMIFRLLYIHDEVNLMKGWNDVESCMLVQLQASWMGVLHYHFANWKNIIDFSDKLHVVSATSWCSCSKLE